MTEKLRIAITGITGLLGQEIYRDLTSAGFDVFGITRRENSELKIELRHSDYSFESLVSVLGDADAVVHLAAHRGGGQSIQQFLPDILVAENISRVAEELSIDTIVFSSSISVYDPCLPTPWREQVTKVPRNNYGIAKLAAEEVLLRNSSDSCRVVSVRLGHLYGAFEENDYLINRFLRLASQGEQLKVCPATCKRRDLTYVADAAAGIRLSLVAEDLSGPVNIGSGTAVSNYEIAEIISNVFELEAPQVIYEWSDTSIPSLLDNSFARDSIGYAPKFSFEEGCKDIKTRLAAPERWKNLVQDN